MRVLGWTIGCVAIFILFSVMFVPTLTGSVSGFLALTLMMGALFLLWLERITAPINKDKSKSDRVFDNSQRAHTETEPKNHTTWSKMYENGKSFADKLMREDPSLFKCSLTNEDYYTIGCQLEQAAGENRAKIHIRRLAQLERRDRLDGGDGFRDEFKPELAPGRSEIIKEGAMIANAIMQKHPELSKCSLRVGDYYVIGLLSEDSAKIHIGRLAQLERRELLDGDDDFRDEFKPESVKEEREIIKEGAMIANAIMQKHPELSKCSLRVGDYYVIGLLSKNKYVDPKEYLLGIVRSQSLNAL